MMMMEMGMICCVAFLVLLWKSLCLFSRTRRFRYIASLSLSPTHNALLLFKLTNFVEFNFLSEKALNFSLFRTFAIPSISKLLHQTHRFSPPTIIKRYDDTAILIQEFVLHHVDSARGSRAIQRLNFIHGRYKIPNDDYLYTLSLFILEPIRFADKYGYRKWSEGEKRAQFVVWHDIGVRMGIENIPQSLEEMGQFKRHYESLNMVYSDSNRAIGDATLDLLLSNVAFFLRPLVKRIVFALFDERLLDAMGYPRQPVWLVWTVENVVRLCSGTFVGWFLPARPMSWSKERIPLEEEGEEEKVYKLRYQVYKPWSYPDGYKVSNVGDAAAGRMGKSIEGPLLCPFNYLR